jgi:hypothetical protein
MPMKNETSTETVLEFCLRKGYNIENGFVQKEGKPYLFIMQPKPYEADAICFGRANQTMKKILDDGIPIVIDEPARIPSWHTKKAISKYMKTDVVGKKFKSFGNMKSFYSPIANYIPNNEFKKL